MHYTFGDDNLSNDTWHFLLGEVLALTQHSAGCSLLVSLHELHRSIVAHGHIAMKESFDFKFLIGAQNIIALLAPL